MPKLRLIRVEPKYANAKHQYCWVEDDDLCVVGHEFNHKFPGSDPWTWVIKEKINLVIADYLYPYVIESEKLDEKYIKADVTEHD